MSNVNPSVNVCVPTSASSSSSRLRWNGTLAVVALVAAPSTPTGIVSSGLGRPPSVPVSSPMLPVALPSESFEERERARELLEDHEVVDDARIRDHRERDLPVGSGARDRIVGEHGAEPARVDLRERTARDIGHRVARGEDLGRAGVVRRVGGVAGAERDRVDLDRERARRRGEEQQKQQDEPHGDPFPRCGASVSGSGEGSKAKGASGLLVHRTDRFDSTT